MTNLNLTASAALHIQNMLSQDNKKALRLSVKKTGCSGFQYAPELVDNPLPDDVETINADIQIYIDAKSLNFFNNITVDLVHDENNLLKQKKLVFINPAETGRCGCGESFTVD